MAIPANIRVQVNVPFPAQVFPSGPVTVTKQNGIYTLGLSVDGLADQSPAAASLPTDFLAVYDSVQKVWFKTSLTELLGNSLAPPTPPQGRLTLTSGTAVMTADVAAATTVFYTGGRFVPLNTAVGVVMTATGGELSQATTDATKSPAACTTNSNYDIFVWSDSGTTRATRGPAWTSDTARGTGAGTTELDFTTAPGFPLNKNAITNGPAAGRGTYVGTIRTNGTSTVDMKFGSAAAGGGKATLGVYNAYNQVEINVEVTDSTASWAYSAGAVRATNNSANNRIEFISGLQTQGFTIDISSIFTTAAVASASLNVGFALNSIAALDRKVIQITQTATALTNIVNTSKLYKAVLGWNFVSGTEASDGTNSVTFSGNAPSGQALSGAFVM